MFVRQQYRTPLGNAFNLLRLIFQATVRDVRKSDRSPVMSIAMKIMQALVIVAVFYVLFDVLGMRGAAIRGDFMMFLMSGIFLFLTHNQAVSAVSGAEGPTSPMMKHAPMNTIVSIGGAALSSLYLQTLSLGLILFGLHVLRGPLVIEDPVGLMHFFLLAWFSGVGIGVLLLALKPWFPRVTQMVSLIYRRANMVASGKMFVANMLPGSMLVMFDWNPLFHAIDQARGAVFINYTPRFTDPDFPLWFGVAFLALGLMAEFFTRKHASASWDAAR